MRDQKEVLVHSISDIFAFLDEYGNDKPLRRILLSFKRQSKEGIIIEITENYPTPEIELEMKMLGFSGQVKATRLDLYNAKHTKDGSKIRSDYLGYIILRPESSDLMDKPGHLMDKPGQRIGDTVIEPPKDRGKLQYFLTCPAKIPVSKGKKSLITYPFFQQHWSNWWECGFATLRMFSKWLKYKTSNIIDAEEKHKNITFPDMENLLERAELSVFEVNDFKKVLEKMGFTLLKYEYNNPNVIPTYPPEQIVYSYMESGVPVFIVFGTEGNDSKEEGQGHVVSVIGHTFNPDAWWPEAEKTYYSRIFKGKPGYLRSIAWVDFIIHDDNYGPFLTIPKDFLRVDFEIYETPWYASYLPPDQQAKLQEERKVKIKNSRIWEVIVPFRKDVKILVDEAEAIAFKTIKSESLWELSENLLEKYNNSTIEWKKTFVHHLNSENVVLRTFLIRASDLQNTFPEEVYKNIKDIFSSKEIGLIPELMWFVEISIPELFAHERYRLGEVIIDATYLMSDIEKDFLKAVKYTHLPGIQQWFKDGEPLSSKRFLINEEPYHHLIRKLIT
jgi:hypothetical protein